jgi:hypothetical protein
MRRGWRGAKPPASRTVAVRRIQVEGAEPVQNRSVAARCVGAVRAVRALPRPAATLQPADPR